jgi:hypothetical protein
MAESGLMLDARKVAHMAANRAKLRAGRAEPVAAVYRTAYGGTTAVSVMMLLKQQMSHDPAVEDRTSTSDVEYIGELDLAIDPRTIAYFALTPATGDVAATDDASIAAAIKLEILGYGQRGTVENRWLLELRRLR